MMVEQENDYEERGDNYLFAIKREARKQDPRPLNRISVIMPPISRKQASISPWDDY